MISDSSQVGLGVDALSGTKAPHHKDGGVA
jgi:hypothetical protein